MATQFLGALNDNIYRFVVSLLILDLFVKDGAGVGFLALSEGLLVLPFILFSTYAGYLADRFSKSGIIRMMKAFEVLIMSGALYCFWSQNIVGLLLLLFLLGLHSAIFSPCKYGILPEILAEENLSKGNGYLEFWTFLAIVFGTSLGGLVKAVSTPPYILPGVIVLAIASCGLFSSFFVPRTVAGENVLKFKLNFISDFRSTISEIRQHRELFLAVIAISFFWGMGAIIRLNALIFEKFTVQASEFETAIFFTIFALGIGLGSVAAGIVSAGKVELGLVPLGAMGIAAFSCMLSLVDDSPFLAHSSIALLGLSGGFFIVPLNSFLQRYSIASSRGRYIAATNLLSFVGVLAASGAVWVFIDILGLTPRQVFLCCAVVTAAVSVYIVRTMPQMLLRCLNWLFSHTIYRLRVFGKEHVPETGGALLVCNHVSYVDPLLLLASIERPIRFLMYRPIYEHRLINPIARAVRAIAVSSEDKPREIAQSLSQARAAIEAGELVCIFAEGAITRTGNLLSFRKGFERIMKGASEAPIIPVHLDELWGSIFSFKGGRFVWKRPKRLPYPATISFGRPLCSKTPAHEVRQAVQELGSNAFRYRRDADKLLHAGFVSEARRHPLRACMVDSQGQALNFGQVLVRAFALAESFRTSGFSGPAIGLLLPPGTAAAICNIAALLAGKIVVNLNYTLSQEAIESAVAKSGISTVVSAKEFIQHLNYSLSSKVKINFVEELANELGVLQKIESFLKAVFLPIRSEANDNLATLIFSSGSTGDPKGVMLSHGNIASNVCAVCDVCQVRNGDVVVGILPFFHSFGFMATLWLPLLSGIKVVYHSNPTDVATIGMMVERHKATMIMTTPTFLAMYTRKCSEQQFASLRYVVVGAEKLPVATASAFAKKYGIMPREGYGATELSPVAMLNIDSFVDGNNGQVGEKLSTVGHPLPGVAVKIVDVETHQTLAPNTEGLLLVKGPNVMLGYWQDEEKTKEVIENGWYITGDIARIDEDGFVTITDRLSRFSKIGGEMVPHVKIEEEIQKVLGTDERRCVVVGVPDERKGEKLVVLSLGELDANHIVKQLRERGLSNLWIPKPENFIPIDAFPILGSGKLDLRALKQYALGRLGSPGDADNSASLRSY